MGLLQEQEAQQTQQQGHLLTLDETLNPVQIPLESSISDNNSFASNFSNILKENLVSSSNDKKDAREFRNNSIFGNYVIASRNIEPNEIIGIESPLSASAYGPSLHIPYCLSCCKDIALSQRCGSCRWPICNSICEMAPQHVQNECPILFSSKTKPRGKIDEYIAIEVLRCLLLRDNDHNKWTQLQSLEPHAEEREKCIDAQSIKKAVLYFLQERCKLRDRFNEEEIDQVLGIISVNTFSGYKFVGKNISLLFPSSVSFFQHDCSPNIRKRIITITEESKIQPLAVIESIDNNNFTCNDCDDFQVQDDNYYLPKKYIISSDDNNNINHNNNKSSHNNLKESSYSSSFAMELTSTRSIGLGDTLSINYVDIGLDVMERGSYLKGSFYFYCDCMKCRVELFDQIHYQSL